MRYITLKMIKTDYKVNSANLFCELRQNTIAVNLSTLMNSEGNKMFNPASSRTEGRTSLERSLTYTSLWANSKNFNKRNALFY